MSQTTAAAQDKALTKTVPAGTVARQEFGAQQMEKRAETASTVLAAQARAQIEARRVVALQRPRNLDEVRTKILREVEREGFAAEAWFRKPVGDGIEGLTIRFAEMAMRCMTNIAVAAPVIYEDESHRMERVEVEDLEANIVISRDVMMRKAVERRFLKKGQEALEVRVNSKGETTYLVRATEDDMLAKEGALFSKYMRTGVLRLLDGGIRAEAQRRIKEILAGDAAKDPDAERKKIADAFASLNVMPPDLKRFLGHELATCSPAEIVNLRGLYSAIKSGEITWAEALEGREGTPADETSAETKPSLDGVTEKLKAQAGAAPPDPTSCKHPNAGPDVLAKIPTGQLYPCDACGEALAGTGPKADEKKGRQSRLGE